MSGPGGERGGPSPEATHALAEGIRGKYLNGFDPQKPTQTDIIYLDVLTRKGLFDPKKVATVLNTDEDALLIKLKEDAEAITDQLEAEGTLKDKAKYHDTSVGGILRAISTGVHIAQQEAAQAATREIPRQRSLALIESPAVLPPQTINLPPVIELPSTELALTDRIRYSPNYDKLQTLASLVLAKTADEKAAQASAPAIPPTGLEAAPTPATGAAPEKPAPDEGEELSKIVVPGKDELPPPTDISWVEDASFDQLVARAGELTNKALQRIFDIAPANLFGLLAYQGLTLRQIYDFEPGFEDRRIQIQSALMQEYYNHQGYEPDLQNPTTIVEEAVLQLKAAGIEPSKIDLQKALVARVGDDLAALIHMYEGDDPDLMTHPIQTGLAQLVDSARQQAEKEDYPDKSGANRITELNFIAHAMEVIKDYA